MKRENLFTKLDPPRTCTTCGWQESVTTTCGVCDALDHGKMPHLKLLLRYVELQHPRSSEIQALARGERIERFFDGERPKTGI